MFCSCVWFLWARKKRKRWDMLLIIICTRTEGIIEAGLAGEMELVKMEGSGSLGRRGELNLSGL